jgi:serine phosphatase RsbU (regulator of sigma subunit)
MAYEENELYLSLDDTIILYTDGLIEAKQDNLLLGEDCMVEKLSKAACGNDPLRITQEMVAIAKGFTGGKPQDDIAIIALRLRQRQASDV